MKIRRHYLSLRKLYPQVREREPLEVTTQELAEALDCTHRNMVLLLRRMQREGWLGWEPKRGRGNRSVLRFLAAKDELILAEAQEIAERQDLARAAAYLGEEDDAGAGLRARFQDWLSGRFGFRSEVRGERRLDLLRFPLPQRIASLDPAEMHFAGESHLVNQLFDGLVRMGPGGTEPLPHLAHAWETDASRRSWTFYLRKGVLFHNGRELTAADVKFSFERLLRLAPKGLFSRVYRAIAAIETPDERTVAFRLRSPNELFLPFLATNRASIVPALPELENGALLGLHPIGTGPFRLAGSSHGIFTLEAFAPYFQGRGFLDVVEVWTDPERREAASVGKAAGRDGVGNYGEGKEEADGRTVGNAGDAADGAEAPAFQVMHNVRLTGPAAERLQQIRQSGTTCKFLTVNELRDGPLRDPAARAALDAALDRGRLIERLSGDVIEAADSFWPKPASDDAAGWGGGAQGLGGLFSAGGMADSVNADRFAALWESGDGEGGASRRSGQASDPDVDVEGARTLGDADGARSVIDAIGAKSVVDAIGVRNGIDADGARNGIDAADATGEPDNERAFTSVPAASRLATANGDDAPIVLATIPQYRNDAELVRDECLKAGIRMRIELIPAELFKGESRLRADLLLFAVMLDEHRELRLIELFRSMLHHLLPGTRQDLERRIDDLMTLRDGDRRNAALRSIEAELRASRSLLFLYRKHLKTAFHPSVRGISLDSLGWVRFRDLWFKPEELQEERQRPEAE
ncbi:SgrR family transcriptional regulator [Paenibacillus sp. MWE-103]|uniref:SgrR family transcriptional regulator n=1 Tax=Paenibacillus artemisiicola TaxID=1172618 RepID=A0ABS3W3B3_9BACL|nr:ABC transporter substrate-binding protein [Paenibacillus artemisiicola]MBO7742630.1 SgrR family transcriptional regulator [Paenibacillus artemisiicola]